MLLITGTDEETGLLRAAEVIESRLSNPRHTGSIPLRLRGGVWSPWLPAPEHPHFQRLKHLWCSSFADYYARQAEELRGGGLRDGADVFVAAYFVTQRDPIGPFSICFWSEGVRSLLPRTDYIGFYRADGGTFLGGDWDTIVRVVGDLMIPADIYPERHLVDDFPSREMLSEIQDSPEGRRLAQVFPGQAPPQPQRF